MDELESTVVSARQIHRDVEGFHDVMGEYLKLLIYVILMHFSPSEKTGRFVCQPMAALHNCSGLFCWV